MPATTLKRKTSIRKKRKGLISRRAKTNFGRDYDDVKFHEGKQYTGMPIGRSHKWYYDKGEWKETKITPDLWQISFNVTKRRAGHAPEGSGAAVGTEYHWYIMAHQVVRKLNKDDYSTELTGLKFKLSHKRAIKNQWASSSAAQRKKLIKFMKEMISDFEQEPLTFELEYKGEKIKGEATAVRASCHGRECFEYDVSINNRHLGMLKQLKTGWKMDNAEDPKLITAVGKAIDIALEEK
jgi:hypothetical protein